MAKELIRVTLTKSPIGRPEQQRRTLTGLGLRRRGATVTRANVPSIRGMVKKVIHLVEFEEVDAGAR